MVAKRKASKRTQKESPDGTGLLVLELQEIHSAESQLSRALPRMSKAAQAESLRQLLEQRQERGERLLSEIDSALEEMDESPGRKKNVAAEGLVNDVREHIQEIAPGPALDAVLIGAIQKTEHYCIAAWGTAKALASALDQESVVESMERAIDEGKSFDEELTEIAESEITPALLSGDGEEMEEVKKPSPVGARRRKNGRAERRLSH
jgi:ferritin-like metal-binding protein YciE